MRPLPAAGPDTDKQRLEAFSDGVIAIIVTIMVLELKPPHEPDFSALAREWPTFLSYALSFLIVAIYWVNHRHVVRYATHVTPLWLWLNLLMLFCISLIPFATAWLGDHLTAVAPNMAYGAVLLASALSFLAVQEVVNRHNRHRADLAPVIRIARLKGLAGVTLYALGIALSPFVPAAMLGVGTVVAGLYFVPVPAAAPEGA